MVEAIWFVIALVMLAVVSVALILMIVLQRDVKATGRETRTQYLSPNYSQSAGFRLTAYPNNELIILQRYWLIDESIAALDYTIVPGRFMTLFIARRGRMRFPDNYYADAFESVEQYDINGLTVTQSQKAGRRAAVYWARGDFEYLIYSEEPEMNMMNGLAVCFVNNTRAERS
ncbi:hypothetical protein H6B10_06650 [Gemmiger formicilis]|uniref:hypothetical protein n=1 Tax=Gemmiger formicilis TaxID=745368 RepID=UPI00195D8B90|nr:hypothetical protein [Gemmiger formicilis]MBM6899386.1 hypothetical protein [Gemmiger formicilis]